MSTPYLVQSAPYCGPERGGTIILVGITGASTLKDNSCVNLAGLVNNLVKIGVVPVSEWGDLQSEKYLAILSKTEQMSLTSENLAMEYSFVVSQTKAAAYAAGSVDDGVIVVLKMPPLDSADAVTISVKECDADAVVSFDFTVSSVNGDVKASTLTESVAVLPSSGIEGGGLLVVELENFPVVYDLAEISVSFDGTHARLLRLVRSDCALTRVHVEFRLAFPVWLHVAYNFRHTKDHLISST